MLEAAEKEVWRRMPAFLERHFLPAVGRNFLQWSVAFLPDTAIAKLNTDIMGHQGPTDVITLTLAPRPWIVETYIGIETVRSNAEKWNVPSDDELLRVCFHSLLHGLGYDDATPDEQATMHALETEWIRRFRRWVNDDPKNDEGQ